MRRNGELCWPCVWPQMFQGTRIIATVVLLVSIAMIFVGAFVIGSGVSFFPLRYTTIASDWTFFSFYASVRFRKLYPNCIANVNSFSPRYRPVLGVHVVLVVVHPIRTFRGEKRSSKLLLKLRVWKFIFNQPGLRFSFCLLWPRNDMNLMYCIN